MEIPSHLDPAAESEHSKYEAFFSRRFYNCTGVFLVALAGYMLFFAGHFVSGDNAQRIAWAKALIDHHSNDISNYNLGVRYSIYGIGPSLLHIPFIIAARAIKWLTGISCEGPVNVFVFELNGALAIALVFGILTRRCGVTRRNAFLRSLAIGFGTI